MNGYSANVLSCVLRGKERLMKILVTYYSKTGNTKAVAQAIYDALDLKALALEDKEITPVGEVDDTKEYSLIFCGFPVYAHSVPVPVQNFIKTLKPGTKLALFSTHGSKTDGQMPKEAIHHAVGLAKDANILGSFTCRGKVASEIIDDLMSKPEHKAWALEAQSAQGHPDQADLEDAHVFARGTLKKAIGFKDFTKK